MKRIFLLLLCAALLCGCSAHASSQSTPPVTETTVPATTEAPPSIGPVWDDTIHSGLREDGTFTEGTLFIGDSLTYGFVLSYLQQYELIGDAKYMAVVGAPLGRFFSSRTFGGGGESARDGTSGRGDGGRSGRRHGGSARFDGRTRDAV